jgi:hypothetical protein
MLHSAQSDRYERLLHKLAEKLAREEIKAIWQLREAGYADLVEQVLDGEIDIDTAMQIFGGRRP